MPVRVFVASRAAPRSEVRAKLFPLEGKEDPDFTKKPDLALALIDRCLARGLQPGSVLLDAGYGNNGPLLVEIEKRDLVYVAAISKSRRLHYKMPGDKERTKHWLDDVAKTLAPDSFQPISLPLEKPRTVWVATLSVYLPKMSGKKIIAIQLNVPTFEEADEISLSDSSRMLIGSMDRTARRGFCSSQIQPWPHLSIGTPKVPLVPIAYRSFCSTYQTVL